MIWLHQYPKMTTLASIFGIPVSSVHKFLHRILKYLHGYLVPKYIKWHSMRHWQRLIGLYPEWPRVVAILDCTPLRISKPKGNLFVLHIFTDIIRQSWNQLSVKMIIYFMLQGVVQQIYYRRDRHCHFLNWLVIVDVLGFIVLSRPGFLGRAHDSTCLLWVTNCILSLFSTVVPVIFCLAQTYLPFVAI